MSRCCSVALLLATLLPASALAQDRAYVRDAGPGPVGRWLSAALRAPYSLVPPGDSARLTIARDSVVATTLVVLGHDLALDGAVQGDVIVVGADLFVHPGARIQGKAVAIGGGVYPSTLASIGGGTESHRDFTFVPVPTPAGFALEYRALGAAHPATRLSFPIVYGLRIPAYDRVAGVSQPVGLLLALDSGRVEIDPTLTYRSHLGVVDPWLAIRARYGRRLRSELGAGRGNFTNDAWIRSDIFNSLTAVVTGRDTRNWYRADRAQITVHRLWESTFAQVEPYVGARVERGGSVGQDSAATSAPWSLFGRRDREDGMLRPNPRVAHGRISSALLGAELHWARLGTEVNFRTMLEIAPDAPGGGFGQGTVHARVDFPTFGTHRFRFVLHGVASVGDSTPPQRYAYLGGTGTLPTFDLLQFGGDQLLYVENRYIIPLERVIIWKLGSPTISLRHMLGAAGVRRLPAIEQNLGIRLELSLLRLDATLDPVSRRSKLTVGLSLLQ